MLDLFPSYGMLIADLGTDPSDMVSAGNRGDVKSKRQKEYLAHTPLARKRCH